MGSLKLKVRRLRQGMREQWYMKDTKGDFEAISQSCRVSPILARLLVSRGIRSKEMLEEYLHPDFSGLHEPGLLKDLELICGILSEKIAGQKKIRIIGDYDVDGVMATYILYQGLIKLGAHIDYEIPDRIKDGYGINIAIIEQARRDGVDTILTCDNGIAAREQIAFAKEQGMTVLVTDHHDIPIEHGIPAADAVTDPKREDCAYPYSGICGAVVALKCIQLMLRKAGREEEYTEYIPYAAIATVCDVMSLENENRILVKLGLQMLEKIQNPGLQALLSATGLMGKKLTAYHLGFVIGPCINASGRLETAKKALNLLLEKNEDAAREMAEELTLLNEERKTMTSEGLAQAIQTVENGEEKQDKVLVVYLSECHESLAGIIAGRLRERYYKPTLVLTQSEDGIKGSGRSIPGYSMFEEISRCQELLTKFGGHPMAAGLSLPKEHLELLRKRLNEQTTLTEEDLVPRITFDMELSLDLVSQELVQELALLEPYGNGNSRPLFAARNVCIHTLRKIGKNQDMLRMTVSMQGSGVRHTALLFQNMESFIECMEVRYGAGAFEEAMAGRRKLELDLIYYPDLNEYQGTVSVQFIVQHFRTQGKGR